MKHNFSIRMIDYLGALIEERHVSNAALKVGINQPAMSLALKRLRELLDDPIIVKTDHGYVATETAIEVFLELRKARALINKALQRGQAFDNNESELEFTIAASESIAICLVPYFIQHVHSINNKLRVSCVHLDLSSAKNQLESGQVDVVLSYAHDMPQALRYSPLAKDEIVGIKSKRQGLKDHDISLEGYLQQEHVYHEIMPNRGSSIEARIDRFLLMNGLSRRKACAVHSTPAVAATVGRSSMVSALPRSVAQLLSASMDINTFALPFELERISIGMYWHDRSHNLGSHRWMRHVLKEVADEVYDTTA